MPNDILASIPQFTINTESLSPQSLDRLKSIYTPLWQQAETAIQSSLSIQVTAADQVTEMKQARAARLSIAKIRQATEKARVELKADVLAMTKAIDGPAKIIREVCEAHEARLEEAEKFAERAEAARKSKLAASRAEILRGIEVDPSPYPLGEITNDAWAQLLEGLAAARDARIAAAKKAEEERIAREKAEAEERARVQAENARLKAEVEARERLAAEERRKAEAELRAAQAKAAKERAEQEAKLKAEVEARERLEREAKAREAAERQRKESEARAAKKAAAAPDADKLRRFAEAIRAVEIPEMQTDVARAVAQEIGEGRTRFANWIDSQAARLGE